MRTPRAVNSPIPPPKRNDSEPRERIWPLDVSIAALAGLVLYISVTQLKFDDPRLLYNAWTYAVGVPVVALLLALFSHSLLSRYVHRSIQLGLLFSLLVHLLLLILAVNVIIFSRYFPEAFTGLRPERSVVRKTLPEYVFQTPQPSSTTPDWSQPVEAETSSRVIPEEPRQLPPVEQSAPKLEVPRPREPEQRPIKKYLTKRNQASESPPMPTNSPTKMARRQLESRTSPFNSRAPVAPDVPTESEVNQPSVERNVSSEQRQPQPFAASLAQPSPRQPELDQPTRPSLEGARTRESELPTVGESGLRSERRQQTVANLQPAGSAPAPQSVPIARIDESASRMISPVDVPLNRQGKTSGAQLSMGINSDTGPPAPQAATSGAVRASDRLSARSGVPEVTAGLAERAPGRASRLNLGAGMTPAGTIRFQPSGNPAASESVVESTATDRLGGQSIANLASQGSDGASAPSLSSAGPALDFLLDDGPVGLTDQIRPLPQVGIAVDAELPRVGAMDLTRPARPKRDVGGPITPFGAKIATVESYNRRVMRTQGGSAPPAAGLVAPATEEAIERGLAYLSSVQNKDGSWSLQGHGSDVALQSDTAATGLCLLAFQGAGYTHRQHQYVDTVSRGLKFLLDNQRTNGDLYRPENGISNRNVALYSHGIAALALCEAYGMTQDPELEGSGAGFVELHHQYPASTTGRLALHTAGQFRHKCDRLDDDGTQEWPTFRFGGSREDV